jgi:superfamily II DNA or RNA helicase
LWDIENVVITMVQTMSQKIGGLDLNGVRLLMVDECHNISSNQMMDVIFQIPGEYRFGFSGTPLKYDILSDLKLIAATGEIIVTVRNKELIDGGFSATPIVHLMELHGDGGGLEYEEAYEQLIVSNTKRNRVVRDVAMRSANGCVLVLVNRIEHGKVLSKMIPGSVFVCGSDATKYRQSVLADMRVKSGVYIASPIFDEGIDVPAIDTLILAAGGESHIKLLQRVGRGMRPKGGANELHIYDFIDGGNEYFENHSKARIRLYEQEGFEVLYD